MKKFLFFFSVLILISIPLGASVQTEINPEYKKGETIIAKVSGNFLETIQKENIHFYRRHIVTALNPYDVKKIEGDFYITAKIGEEKIPDNYSIVIEGVLHKEGSQSTREDITLNFKLLNETADFSIWPASIYSSEDFYIEVQNLLGMPLEITINEWVINETASSSGGNFFDWLFGGGDDEIPQSGGNGNSITLLSGEIKNINFEVGNSTEFTTIKLSSSNQEYNIPAYLISNFSDVNETEGNVTIIEEDNQSESKDEETIVEEEIINEGEEVILNETEIAELENTPVFEEKGYLRTCEELRGNVCNNNEECNGTERTAKNIICCLGECIKKEEKKNNNKVIGWALIIVVAIVIFYFVRAKSKKTKQPVNLSRRIRR